MGGMKLHGGNEVIFAFGRQARAAFCTVKYPSLVKASSQLFASVSEPLARVSFPSALALHSLSIPIYSTVRNLNPVAAQTLILASF